MHLVAALRGLAVREGGYALAGARPLAARGTGRWPSSAARRADQGDPRLAWVASAAIMCEVGASAFGRHSATPYLLPPAHPGREAVHVLLIVLTGSAVRLDELAAGVQNDGRVLQLCLPDGERLRVQTGTGDLGRGPTVVDRW